MILIHVGDVFVANSGNDDIEKDVNKLCARLPLGEWDYNSLKQPHGVRYCGKEITVSEEEVQWSFN